MDQRKLISIVKQYPRIWDRSHPYFRDRDKKDTAWVEIGSAMNVSANICRETFKSVREKYVREREKSRQLGDNYREWDMLNELKFLDPNIVPRKQSLSSEEDLHTAEEFKSKISSDCTYESNPTDFDRNLVALVKQTTPIWDRNCNTYPNKQLKHQLWKTIAQKLSKDINVCMLRWKALREKYIRQKTKHQEVGVCKWELLDDMSFLDHVIMYRRKLSDVDSFSNSPQAFSRHHGHDLSSSLITVHDFARHHDSLRSQENDSHLSFEGDNSMNDSSNDFLAVIKEENTVLQIADSSLGGGSSSRSISRKRSSSAASEAATTTEDKRHKLDEATNDQKTPEQLFGDLVSVLLSRKPERERNLAMIEIMTVLSK